MRYDLTSMLGGLVVMWAASLGCGLALERLLGLRLKNALLLPLGMCVAFVLIFPGYVAGVGDALAISLLAAVAIGGFVFATDGLWARLNPGWPGLAGIAVYVLFMLPVLVHGAWTWAGYDFVNDPAFEMLLADHIRGYGTVLGNLPESGEQQFLNAYLSSGYPLGTQSLLGTFAAILEVPSAVIYQAFISVLAAIAAVSIAGILERLMSARRAACAAFVAASANLTYQYALQGSIKEIGLVAVLAATAAVGEAAWRLKRPYAAAVLIAVAVAASLAVYNAVALAFLGGVVLILALGFLALRRLRPNRSWLAPLVLGPGLAGVLAIPSLVSFATFFEVGQAGQGSTGTGSVQFGQLLRVLPLSQISGVWLAGEYRLPVVPQPAGTLTAIAAGVILVLAIPGALWAVRRRVLGPIVLLGAVGIVLLVVFPRVSPYAQGKLLAVGGPAVLLGALIVPLSLKGRGGAVGLAVAALLGVAVLASDLLAYSRARIAPTARMEAIAEVGEHFRGQGLVLWNEFEEYAKYFGRAARISNPFEALTPRQVKLRDPTYFYGHYFDLDEEQLSFVEQFPIIVTRRSPAASRPPANYTLAYQNRYYLAWRRHATPRVIAHLPEQRLYSSSARVSCPALGAMVAGAPRGSELIAATPAAMSWFEPLYSKDRSFAWGIVPSQPGAVAPNGPGHASGTVHAASPGRYSVWIQGDFPRPTPVYLDGRHIGTASESNTPLQWDQVASVHLGRGAHVLRVVRTSGHRHLKPGEWQIGLIGALAIEREEPERLTSIPLARWRALCGTYRDWVEVVHP